MKLKHRYDRWLILILALVLFSPGAVPVASAGSQTLTSAITLQRGSNSVSSVASGNVVAAYTPAKQTFEVTVRGIKFDEPVDGLGVFLSDQPFDTNNFYLVNTLDVTKTNVWHLKLKDSTVAPEQLGVADVRLLAGHWIRIVDVATNVYLETLMPPFELKINSLSYKAKVKMQRPDPAPSPDAIGVLRVKLKADTGASVLEVRTHGLNAGNSYCLWILGSLNQVTAGEECPKTPNLVRGEARFGSDTGTGEQLLEDGLVNGDVRVDQLSGSYAVIRDQFGVTHLYAQIP